MLFLLQYDFSVLKENLLYIIRISIQCKDAIDKFFHAVELYSNMCAWVVNLHLGEYVSWYRGSGVRTREKNSCKSSKNGRKVHISIVCDLHGSESIDKITKCPSFFNSEEPLLNKNVHESRVAIGAQNPQCTKWILEKQKVWNEIHVCYCSVSKRPVLLCRAMGFLVLVKTCRALDMKALYSVFMAGLDTGLACWHDGVCVLCPPLTNSFHSFPQEWWHVLLIAQSKYLFL